MRSVFKPCSRPTWYCTTEHYRVVKCLMKSHTRCVNSVIFEWWNTYFIHISYAYVPINFGVEIGITIILATSSDFVGLDLCKYNYLDLCIYLYQTDIGSVFRYTYPTLVNLIQALAYYRGWDMRGVKPHPNKIIHLCYLKMLYYRSKKCTNGTMLSRQTDKICLVGPVVHLHPLYPFWLRVSFSLLFFTVLSCM